MCGSAVTPYQLQYQLKAKSFPVLCNLALKSATCHYSMYLPLSYCRNTIWGKHTQTHKAMVNLSAPTHCDASGRSPFAKWEKKQLGMEHPQYECSQWGAIYLHADKAGVTETQGPPYKRDKNQIIRHGFPLFCTRLNMQLASYQQQFWGKCSNSILSTLCAIPQFMICMHCMSCSVCSSVHAHILSRCSTLVSPF